MTEHPVSETYDESKLANDALVSHLCVIESGAAELGPHPHPLLLPGASTKAKDTALDFGINAIRYFMSPAKETPATETSPEVGMDTVRRFMSPLLIGTLNRIAAHHNMTLNSILLGTLATHLRARSGQDRFAINQTYLGRRPDQLCAVGSYSGSVPMEFVFDDKTSPLSVCQHAFTETMRNMAASDRAVATATLEANVSYELNDVRPLPRPSALPRCKVVLSDLFFAVTEYVDGFDAVVMYDVSKFDNPEAELLLDDWLLTLEGLEEGWGAE